MDNKKIKIACVGDSITFGYASSNPDVNSYPSIIQKKLGDGYKVGNFGLSGSTLMPGTFFPYFDSEEHKGALAMLPDAVVLMLGTNDSCFYPDRAAEKDFSDAADKILETFEKLPSKPKIFYCLVPHLFSNAQFAESIKNIILPLQKKAAEKHGLEIIDVYSALSKPEMFIDGVHPTDDGYRLLADTIYSALSRYFKINK